MWRARKGNNKLQHELMHNPVLLDHGEIMSEQKRNVERQFISQYSDLILFIPSRQPHTFSISSLSSKIKVKHQLSLTTVMKIRKTTFQWNLKLRIFYKIISVSIYSFKMISMASNSTVYLGSSDKKSYNYFPGHGDTILEFENVLGFCS